MNCVVCRAVDGAGSAETAAVTVLAVLEILPRKTVVRDLCLPHNKRVAEIAAATTKKINQELRKTK